MFFCCCWGTKLITQGGIADKFYIIKTGLAEWEKINDNGTYKGEMSEGFVTLYI